MKTLKISLGSFILGLVAVLFMFSSCEKNDITTVDSEVVPGKYVKQDQDAKSGDDDALVYLEIPEEHLADPEEEMDVYEDNGPFYTEDGEAVEGLLVIEVAVESGALFTFGVSQNLVDMGLVNGDWSSYRSVGYYQNQCCNAECRKYTDPYTRAHCCSNYCFWWGVGRAARDLFN